MMKKSMFNTLLLVLSMMFFLRAAYEYYPFWKSEKDTSQLRELTISKDNQDNQHKKRPDIDWKKLYDINPDIIAWIKVPGTKIDYPVLKCKEWNEYLHKDYYGDYSYPGSIFVQPKQNSIFEDRHMVIYGHNMRSKSMFGSLHKFEEKSFYKKHKKVYIYLPDRTVTATVYSCYDCSDTTSTYQTQYINDEDWANWISLTIRKQYYKTNLLPRIQDRVLTLSTCSNGRGHNSRYVVHAMISKVEIYDE